MSTTVTQLFNHHNIFRFKKMEWGEIPKVEGNDEGVYIISSSNNPNKHLGITSKPAIDGRQLDTWIKKHKDFKIDNQSVSVDLLSDRLTEFWLEDESILYIGKAGLRKKGTGIKKRINEFYKTEIGEKGPHAGGQWIKALSDLENFTIYYCVCDKPNNLETEMLKFFSKNVSNISVERLSALKATIPFANVSFKGKKKHGFTNHYFKR